MSDDTTLRQYVEEKTNFATLAELQSVSKQVAEIHSVVVGVLSTDTGVYVPGLLARVSKIESSYASFMTIARAGLLFLAVQIGIQAVTLFFTQIGKHL